MANFYTAKHIPSTRDKMDHEARIQAAIRDLESQEGPNVSATTRKHNVA